MLRKPSTFAMVRPGFKIKRLDTAINGYLSEQLKKWNTTQRWNTSQRFKNRKITPS